MAGFGILTAAFAAAMRKLKEELGIGARHGAAGFYKLFEKGFLLIVVEPEATRGDAAVGANRRRLDHNQPRP